MCSPSKAYLICEYFLYLWCQLHQNPPLPASLQSHSPSLLAICCLQRTASETLATDASLNLTCGNFWSTTSFPWLPFFLLKQLFVQYSFLYSLTFITMDSANSSFGNFSHISSVMFRTLGFESEELVQILVVQFIGSMTLGKLFCFPYFSLPVYKLG